MKRLVAIAVLLLVILPSVRADGPDDQYVQIYNIIQDGDALSAAQPSQAQAKYVEAQKELLKFQKIYPTWNERVVKFRLNYLASKITIASANALGVSNAPAAEKPPVAPPQQAASPSTNAPAPAAQPAAAPAPTPSLVAPVQETPAPPVPALVTTPSEVQTSTPPMIVLTPQTGPSAADLQNQISELQNELKRLHDDKLLTEAKLREALAARPAGADPREFAQAQEKIRSIEKENELLRVSLAQEREKVASMMNSAELEKTKRELTDTKLQLAQQTARTTQLVQENEALQAQIKALTASNADMVALRSENESLKKAASAKPAPVASPVSAELTQQLAKAQATIASLEADKDVWRLEKAALQNRVKQLSNAPAGGTAATAAWTQDTEHVKQLERERDDLQKRLDAAQKELYGRKGKSAAVRVDELATQLETMRARLDIYEAKPVPYTPEELALFKRPVSTPDPRAGQKSVRELPSGTASLVAEAQRDFAAGRLPEAEKKYLEVLRRDDKNVSTLANLATVQLEMGHLDDAEKNLRAALAVSPDDAFALSILGNLKFRQEKYDDALDALSRAAKVDPENAEVQNFLGLALSQKGMRNAAEAAFRKAILLKPNYGSAQNNLAVFYLTQQPPSVELARWHYDKAIATGFPRNPEMEKMFDEKKTAEAPH
jgi:tetratricopeptide (TPR) repeat protein